MLQTGSSQVVVEQISRRDPIRSKVCVCEGGVPTMSALHVPGGGRGSSGGKTKRKKASGPARRRPDAEPPPAVCALGPISLSVPRLLNSLPWGHVCLSGFRDTLMREDTKSSPTVVAPRWFWTLRTAGNNFGAGRITAFLDSDTSALPSRCHADRETAWASIPRHSDRAHLHMMHGKPCHRFYVMSVITAVHIRVCCPTCTSYFLSHNITSFWPT